MLLLEQVEGQLPLEEMRTALGEASPWEGGSRGSESENVRWVVRCRNLK